MTLAAEDEIVEFFDRLPRPLIDALPSPELREQALLRGLDLARRAHGWSRIPVLYDGDPIGTVHIRVSRSLRDRISQMQREFGLARRIVTCTAFHYAVIDRLGPFFSEAVQARHTALQAVAQQIRDELEADASASPAPPAQLLTA